MPTRVLAVLLLVSVSACGGKKAARVVADDGSRRSTSAVEEVTSWPPPGGVVPRFAWTSMTLERRNVEEELGPDGKPTREEDPPSRIIVAEATGGGVSIAFPEEAPSADADAFTRALSRNYYRLHVVTRPDGQIDHVGGIDEFAAAVKADPDSVEGRALFDKPEIRRTIEASVEENYVAWIVTWLDMAWIPEPGRTVRLHRASGAVVTMSTEDLSQEAPGRQLLRVRVEGKSTDISIHRTFLDDLVPPERYAQATGFYQIELVTDPRTLVPVRATIEKELRAGDARGWKRQTTTFTVVPD
jgi:hypothetical protein